MTTQTGPGVALLDLHACWALLRGCEVGRLAVVVDGRPEIFPITFAVDHGSVVFRSGPGSKLTAAAPGAAVAFEADGYQPEDGLAWSVVVKGRVERRQGVQDMVDLTGVPLFPWHAEPKPTFVRIVPDDVTGRRFAVVRPSHGDQGPGGGRAEGPATGHPAGRR